MRRLLLLAGTLVTVGCVRPLPLRSDVSMLATGTLRGVGVSVSAVRDTRDEAAFVGQHRDGLVRMTQWRWRPEPALDVAAKAMLLNALGMAGAELVPPPEAQLHLTLDILAAEITDDDKLAGEQTFGRVWVRLVALDPLGAVVSDRLEQVTISRPGVQDPGLLGVALYGAMVKAVTELATGLPHS